MITRLKIDNFKSIKGLDLVLGPLNFVVGPNASGKSNLADPPTYLIYCPFRKT
jgi:AAA15 family ATPase/GTPase